LEEDRPRAQTLLARLAARIDDSTRRAKPRARRLAEAGAREGSVSMAVPTAAPGTENWHPGIQDFLDSREKHAGMTREIVEATKALATDPP